MQPRRFSVDFVHPSRDDILLYFSDLYEMEHGMTIRLSPTKFILVRSERGARKDSLCLHKKLFSRSTVIFLLPYIGGKRRILFVVFASMSCNHLHYDNPWSNEAKCS